MNIDPLCLNIDPLCLNIDPLRLNIDPLRLNTVCVHGRHTCLFYTGIPEGATENVRKDFLGEAQMLASFKHSNVMGLLKVVTRSEPVLIVIPYMSNGDLKNYLKRWVYVLLTNHSSVYYSSVLSLTMQ